MRDGYRYRIGTKTSTVKTTIDTPVTRSLTSSTIT